jgi:1-acyl-sn-glycerol-3-phosphate acyltransferase
MSMFETIVLPSIIQPILPVTFVVKRSLLEYPFFRHIIRSRDPIPVSRENPREDFKTVISGGLERLEKGISVVVFPQTTRSSEFDSSKFNTIGVKLARKAKVPIIPIALVTDAWGNGKWFKDLGSIDPTKRVRLAFGEPIHVHGRGAEAHQQIINFIEGRLKHWSDSAASPA